MNAEFLYNTIERVHRQYGYPGGPGHAWALLAPDEKQLWVEVAAEYQAHEALHAFDFATRTRKPPDWRVLLQLYGRHDPKCPPGAPCTCGFAEVEKQLAPIAPTPGSLSGPFGPV